MKICQASLLIKSGVTIKRGWGKNNLYKNKKTNPINVTINRISILLSENHFFTFVVY